MHDYEIIAKRLGRYAREGNVLGVRTCLAQPNVKVDAAIGDTGVTALFKASTLEVARLLVDAGANPNARSKNGDTPLMAHISGGRTAIVTYLVTILVSLGVDLNALSDLGYSPLHIAIQSEDEESVSALLDANVDVNVASVPRSALRSDDESDEEPSGVVRTNVSPLHFAADAGLFGSAWALLDKGARIDSLDSTGASPLLYALASRDGERIARLLVNRGADVTQCDEHGESPLMLSVIQGGSIGLELCELLIARGAPLDTQNKRGWTALHMAAKFRELEIVRLLIRSGANVNVRLATGETAIYIASQERDIGIVRELLAVSSLDAVSRRSDGMTPLHAAVMENDDDLSDSDSESDTDTTSRRIKRGTLKDAHDIVVELIRLDPDSVDAVTDMGDSPLHILSMFCSDKDCSDDVDAPFKPEYAVAVGTACDIMSILLSACRRETINARDSTGSTPLWRAAAAFVHDDTRIVSALLSAGAKADIVDDEDWTPLHIAAQRKYVAISTLLLDAGSPVDARESIDGATPLFIAAQEGACELVNLLLERGANANAPRSLDGRTPLYAAIKSPSREAVNVVQRLLAGGADVNACQRNGLGPLSIARRRHYSIIEGLLVSAGAKGTGVGRAVLLHAPPAELPRRLDSCLSCWIATPRRECDRSHWTHHNCAICMKDHEGVSDLRDWVTLHCGHLYHRACIMAWAASKTSASRNWDEDEEEGEEEMSCARCPLDRCAVSKLTFAEFLCDGETAIETPRESLGGGTLTPCASSLGGGEG